MKESLRTSILAVVGLALAFIRLLWLGADGERLGLLGKAKDCLEGRGERVRMLTNGGIPPRPWVS